MITPGGFRVDSSIGDSMGTSKQRERWPGGYVRKGVFVIERKIGGVKFHHSTHCTSLRAAMKQLERFEADPAAYRPEGDAAGGALVLDEAMVEAFFAWHLPRVSREWALNVRNVLFDWADHLKGRDLRRLNLISHLKPHLKGASMQHHRVKAIRLLFGWLREELGVVTRAQDVTLDLPVPAVKPAQAVEDGQATVKAMTWATVQAVAPHLRPDVRDVLDLLVATGWHVNEVRRFAQSGTIRPRGATDKRGVISVVGTVQKSGMAHFTALQVQAHADAAARIRARGHVMCNSALAKHADLACAKATALAREQDPKAPEVGPFNFGWMRHSVSTWLTQDGVPVAKSSRFLGHASPATTVRHYIDAQAAAVVLPSRALRVVR